MQRLTGKVAIVTGAGSGIGRACMLLFAREGSSVVGAGRTLSNISETLQLVEEEGGRGDIVAADLRNEDGAREVVEATLSRFGRVDILVHCAGVGYSWARQSHGAMNDVISTLPEKWREVVAMNLDTCYLMCRAVLPHMIDQGGGAIVNVASISGLFGLPEAHAYTAAKAGVINLTRSLAVAYAGRNIRANCVAPGLVDTPMVAPVMSSGSGAAFAGSRSPMRRPGQPGEIAHACLFLASDDASYCNGAMLVVDGGASAKQ